MKSKLKLVASFYAAILFALSILDPFAQSLPTNNGGSDNSHHERKMALSTYLNDFLGMWLRCNEVHSPTPTTAVPTNNNGAQPPTSTTTAVPTKTRSSLVPTNTLTLTLAPIGATLKCPENGEDAIEFSTTRSSLLLEKCTIGIGSLCTLMFRNKGAITSNIPLGRCYDGGEWESVGVGGGSHSMSFDCDDGFCQSSQLPSGDVVFTLSSFSMMKSMQSIDIASRLLEQTTFGPTREALAQWEDVTLQTSSDLDYSFAEWVHDQIYNVPMTSHREYFRTKSTTRARTTVDQGTINHPCDPNSRWHVYALTNTDYMTETEEESPSLITFEPTSDGSAYTLFVNGVPRTEVTSLEYYDAEVDEDFEMLDISRTYRIDYLNEYVGGYLELRWAVDDDDNFEGGPHAAMEEGAPRIQFTSANPQLPPNIIRLAPSARTTKFVQVPGTYLNEEFFLVDGLDDKPICESIPVGTYPVYIDFQDGNHWLAFDPRLTLRTNTVETPLSDGGGESKMMGSFCSNAPRTFLNEESCVYTADVEACDDNYLVPDVYIPLDLSTLSTFYDLTGRYVYAVEGLTADSSPCIQETESKWINIGNSPCDDDTANTFSDDTANTLRYFLEDLSYGEDKNVQRKIWYTADDWHWNDESTTEEGDCDIAASTPSDTKDIIITADSKCWQLVHIDHHVVYDFTEWVAAHPGGADKIKQFAEDGSFILQYPHGDEMWRWYTSRDEYLLYVDEFGGEATFRHIPDELQTIEVSEALVGTHSALRPKVISCGSPFETSNDPTLGETGISSYNVRINEVDSDPQKQVIWAKIALSADDQLRQRMAYALSQMFAISPPQMEDEERKTEGYMTFYDIFVRHAFGNFFDILKEISYNSLMAKMLTYWESKSSAYIWRELEMITFADENFAREVMQLFSIGTILLNMDGTPKLNEETNQTILSYTNEHIMSYARAWTGFTDQIGRGNIETKGVYDNSIDPMRIQIEWRDVFPKINLQGGYIGDTYPLCVDMPEKAFLRKGAKYRLLGSSKDLELLRNPDDDYENKLMEPNKAFRLDPSSELYNILCNPSSAPGGSDCDFKVSTILDQNIECYGKECEVDTVRLIEINDGTFLEYVQKPCVDLAFFNDAKTILQHWSEEAMCGDPRSIVASEACCKRPDNWYAKFKNCQYADERVTFQSATKRCQQIDKMTCTFETPIYEPDDRCFAAYYHWHDSSCSVKAKIQDSTGYVGVVHEPYSMDDGGMSMNEMMSSDTHHFFPVYWTLDEFPSKEANSCGNGLCEETSNGCLCNVVVEQTPVFLTAPSSMDIVIASLHVGSSSPDTFDEDYYESPISTAAGFKVYFASGQTYDEDTIFEVTIDNKKIFLRNVQSNVFIIDETSGDKSTFSFRNPPHFISFADPDPRDAYYETEEVLTSYFRHPNVPPFVAVFLIQRFGISNPSPRYVEQVATAFQNGIYEFSIESSPMVTFGSSSYGDLSATIAAVIMDKEARSVTLDLDPTKGSLRDPLLKIMHYMRSMEYNTFDRHRYHRHDTELVDMTQRIGMMVWEIKSVFSFFRREFSPVGPIQEASLVGPEALRYNAPDVVGTINGLNSLIKYGLSACNSGFGSYNDWEDEWCEKEGKYKSAWGKLDYNPKDPLYDPRKVVDELSTLLTSGRLNDKSRDIITKEIAKIDDNAAGLRLAQQLIAVTPEFHSTNLMEFNGESRPIPEPVNPSTLPYKSIVFVNLEGGMDSYNLFVPHSECHDRDMYAEYAQQRGSVALPKGRLLKIGTGGQPQVCDKFGIHPDLPALKALYDDQDLIFLANTGILFEYVNKDNWEIKTPTQLFAHNIQHSDIQQIDPHKEYYGTGFIGRMADVLTSNGYTTGSFSMSGEQVVLNGEPAKSPSVSTVMPYGLPEFNPIPSTENMRSIMFDLNNETTSTSGYFGKSWSKMFDNYVHETENLRKTLGGVDYSEKYPDSWLGQQLGMVSSVMQMKSAFGHDRHFFYVESGGWDTHLNQAPQDLVLLPELNNALDAFVKTTKEQGLWDQTLVIVSSEFARTFMANGGAGTDHAWGGNYFIFGGDVKGGKIMGTYPDDLKESGPLDLGRGRFIPTTSWETVYNGVAEHLGITKDEDLDKVLPNRHNFVLYGKNDLFV